MKDYTVIKSEEQYKKYISIHKKLFQNPTPENADERELLDVLIEKWENDTLKREKDDSDPVELLQWLMENHNLSASRLSGDLGITKGTMSKILNYKKGMSKYVIRKLAEVFKLSQEAFNREYKLTGEAKKVKKKIKNKTTKKVKAKNRARKLAKV